MKNDLKADQECITACLTAIEKLMRYHFKETSGDSVAEANGKHAIVRVLQYINRFAERKYHIGE